MLTSDRRQRLQHIRNEKTSECFVGRKQERVQNKKLSFEEFELLAPAHQEKPVRDHNRFLYKYLNFEA